MINGQRHLSSPVFSNLIAHQFWSFHSSLARCPLSCLRVPVITGQVGQADTNAVEQYKRTQSSCTTDGAKMAEELLQIHVAALSAFISVPLARIVPAPCGSSASRCWRSLQSGPWLSGCISSVLSCRHRSLKLLFPADALYPPEPWLQQSF